MSLEDYFKNLIKRVEESDTVHNQGKDKNGFFLPVKTVALRHLNRLLDLHGKPLAAEMVKDSWEFIVSHLPPEWLVLTSEQKAELKKILKR